MPTGDSTAKSGIYQIRNTTNGKVYVGSAVHLGRRRDKHWRELAAGAHHSARLQASWNKHGAGCFAFEIIRLVRKKENLIRVEQHFLDLIKPSDPSVGYNMSPTAGSILGFALSDEARAKIAASKVGKKRSPETVAKMVEGHRGVVRPTGWTHSAETRKKLSESLKGRSLSTEHRAKLSEIMKARTRLAETYAKISAAQIGRKQSPETRAKVSAANKGRRLSEEHRQKISDGLDRHHRHARCHNSEQMLLFPLADFEDADVART